MYIILYMNNRREKKKERKKWKPFQRTTCFCRESSCQTVFDYVRKAVA